jgi:hypothetical protein
MCKSFGGLTLLKYFSRWSYGVLLYELFSFGGVPYSGLGSGEILPFLESGQRLQKPAYFTNEIYDLMSNCWKLEPKERPTATQICQQLAKILEVATSDYGYLSASSFSSTNANTESTSIESVTQLCRIVKI